MCINIFIQSFILSFIVYGYEARSQWWTCSDGLDSNLISGSTKLLLTPAVRVSVVSKEVLFLHFCSTAMIYIAAGWWLHIIQFEVSEYDINLIDPTLKLLLLLWYNWEFLVLPLHTWLFGRFPGVWELGTLQNA
jgi:hypothetical protein